MATSTVMIRMKPNGFVLRISRVMAHSGTFAHLPAQAILATFGPAFNCGRFLGIGFVLFVLRI